MDVVEMRQERQNLMEKWEPVLNIDGLPNINDYHKRATIAALLENQQKDGIVDNSAFGLLSEAAPTNAMGASAADPSTGNVKGFNPILVSMIRRSQPNLLAFDTIGVQPMNAPVGLVFAFKSHYDSQTGTEALHNEANTVFSGSSSGNALSQTHTGTSPAQANSTNYTTGSAFSTAFGEALGDGAGNHFNEMALSIDRITVTAKERGLKAEFTVEMAQDLMAWHGLDAESELATMLSNQMLFEQNREVIRTVNISAKAGAQINTANAGEFDLDLDSNGRWGVEKFKMLYYQIARDLNAIAKDTRRGRGNFIITSSDVADALEAAKILSYSPDLATKLQIDDTGNTFAGTIGGGRVKVFIDPYFDDANGWQYYTAGYKGPNPWDSGLFYCPYVPLKMFRAVGENTFQPKIAFKTRYGMTASPFATAAGDGAMGWGTDNKYYRRVGIKNIM